MRLAAIFLIFSIVMSACSAPRKFQEVQTANINVDTIATQGAETIMRLPLNTEAVVKDVFIRVIKKKILFNTFNARARVKYEGAEGGDDGNVFIRMKKDSLIWLSLRGTLGIEGFRILITPDSVTLVDHLKKNVQQRSFDLLRELTGLSLNFQSLQDLVIGNPIYFDTSVVSPIADGAQLLTVAGEFKNILTVDTTVGHLVNSRLIDTTSSSRGYEISYGNYQETNGISFPAERRIRAAEQSKLDVEVDFKQYSFNQPTSFPFSIPKNYKRL